MRTATPQVPARGFTVIELLTVLALAAIILALAIPRYSGLLADLRVQSATSALVLDLRTAQSTARARGSRVTFVFGEHDYTIQRPGATPSRVLLPRGVSIGAVNSWHVIWFAADGSSSGGFVTLRGASEANTVLVAAARGLAYAIPGVLR